MKHAGPIAWRDVEGDVSIHFCASDGEPVTDLAVGKGPNPLGRCSVARASFVLRDGFEALLNDARAEPDPRPLEPRCTRRPSGSKRSTATPTRSTPGATWSRHAWSGGRRRTSAVNATLSGVGPDG